MSLAAFGNTITARRRAVGDDPGPTDAICWVVASKSGAISAGNPVPNYGTGSNFASAGNAFVSVANGLELDGSGDYIYHSGTEYQGVVDTMTFCAHMRTGTIGTRMAIFSEYVQNDPPWLLEVNSSSGRLFTFPGANNDVVGATTLLSNTWYWICATYDSAAGSVIYIDNGADGTDPTTGTLTRPATSGLQIGRYAAIRQWSGYLDDLRVFNRVITAAERARIYAWNRG